MLLSSAVALALAASTATAAPAAPPTAKKPVTDTYHGVTVVDDYRWLEDWNDPAVKAWSEAQNAYARSVLDPIASVAEIRARVTQVETSVGVEYHAVKSAGGRYFASKNQPPKQQPLIVLLPSLDKTTGEQVILDPNTLDTTGGTSYDWFVPSNDGKFIAVSLSQGGSESGDVHIYNVDTRQEVVGDMVPRVNGGTAGGSVAWLADGTGFFYTRYPRAGERPEADMSFYTQVYFHKMGTATTADRYETGKDYPKIAEIMLEVSPDGAWALANVQDGDGGQFIQDLRGPDGSWTRLTKWTDRVVEAKFGSDHAAYLVSRKDAPNGKLLRLPLPTGTEKPALASAKEIIAQQPKASIETNFGDRTGLYTGKDRLYVLYQVGGPNELRAFDLTGKSLGSVPAPEISTIGDVEVTSGDDLSFQIDSFTTPAAYYQLSVGSKGGIGTLAKTALVTPEPPNMPKLEVKREFATSKDGTKVPVNIIMPAGLKPDGKTPTLVWGYGGYGVNETPGFSRRRLIWVEQGCISVLVNIRGGGEYGETWHTDGNLTKKQNVFDDFAAACQYMIEKGYTSHDKLAIMGGSNGGLLMGATFTQLPTLCKAVVSSVGIYDMLRVELSSNGAFNITEFGTVTDPAQFKALYAYSPYHHVKQGTQYPAILFMTGANDPRVDPMQSRKMTALVQAANPKNLVLLRTSGNTGHGMGTPLAARIEQTVDTYAFLFDQLGVAYKPVGGK